MNIEMKYDEGDVVRLKSGGPKMTVNGYMEFGEVHCQWFEDAEMKKGFFAEGSLAVVKQDGSVDAAERPRRLNSVQESVAPGAAE